MKNKNLGGIISTAWAAQKGSGGGLLPCGGGDPCTACDLVFLVNNLFSFLVKITLGIAILILVAVGIIYITSAGSKDLMARAKKALIYVLGGFFFSLLAWVLINVVAQGLGYKGPGGQWWQLEEFQCDFKEKEPLGIKGTHSLDTTAADELALGKADVSGNQPFSIYRNGKNVSYDAETERLLRSQGYEVERTTKDGEPALRIKMAAAGGDDEDDSDEISDAGDESSGEIQVASNNSSSWESETDDLIAQLEYRRQTHVQCSAWQRFWAWIFRKENCWE